MPGESSCPLCIRKVAKSAKALRCSWCREWCHIGCAELEEADYLFMSRREKLGFRWYCPGCKTDADDAANKKRADKDLDERFQTMESLMVQHMKKLDERLDQLEGKFAAEGHQPQMVNVESPKFTDVVKRALQDEKQQGVIVNDRGSVKTVENQNVLILKSKSGTEITDPIKEITEALDDIQVSSCNKTKSGGLVVKFPSTKAMKDASQALNNRLGPDAEVNIREPKKMLPKMTVPDISKSLADDEIVPSILRKNPSIRKLVEGGCTLLLLFTRTKEQQKSKTAVLKMAPEIRSQIVKENNYIYVGLGRCRAYDRFWVAQCYHCQGFGHVSSECPKKNAGPVCAFCADAHESRTCGNKNSPRCVNCSKLEKPPDSISHFASSSSCPVMISQRRKVMENTDFTCSKNLASPL